MRPEITKRPPLDDARQGVIFTFAALSVAIG
jgi:hypothetical protein